MKSTFFIHYILLIIGLLIFDQFIKQYSANFSFIVGFFYELFLYFSYHISINRKIKLENTFLQLSVTLLSISIVIASFRFFVFKDYFGTGFSFFLVFLFYVFKFSLSFFLSYFLSIKKGVN